MEMRPSCEHCDTDLPADAPGAHVCSFECTFCDRCAADVLRYVCPNCTGWLVPRPPRPTEKLVRSPGSTQRVHHPVDVGAHVANTSHRHAAAVPQVHLWEVVVDCTSPAHLAAFYAAVCGVDAVVRSDDWAWIEPFGRGVSARLGGARPPAGGVRIAFQRVPEPRIGKVRLHLDLGAADLAATLAVVIANGGRALGPEQGDEQGRFVVCADPEGHEFCLVEA